MCGRFSTGDKYEGLSPRLQKALREYKQLQNHYNAAPSQALPVVTNKQPGQVQSVQWGLVRGYEKDFKNAFKPINARAETLTEKRTFHDLLQSRRCLIPADGFYEWQKTPGGKIPFRFTLKDDNAFCFAGLWDEWADKSSGEVRHTFTIITTAPNTLLQAYHNRMPVILTPAASEKWLDDSLREEAHLDLLQPYDPEQMKAQEVSKKVNAVSCNDPDLIQPFENEKPPEQLGLFN